MASVTEQLKRFVNDRDTNSLPAEPHDNIGALIEKSLDSKENLSDLDKAYALEYFSSDHQRSTSRAQNYIRLAAANPQDAEKNLARVSYLLERASQDVERSEKLDGGSSDEWRFRELVDIVEFLSWSRFYVMKFPEISEMLSQLRYRMLWAEPRNSTSVIEEDTKQTHKLIGEYLRERK
jgi:hypothetical protein